jgi:CubicO group peptidase (beta-lactamase class C family)
MSWPDHRWFAVLFAFLLSPVVADAAKVGQRKPPMTGTAVPEFAPLEEAVIDYGYIIKCTAAVAAVSKDGELVYSRGFGWRDTQKKKPVQPDTLMRASYPSRAITAAAARTLVRDGKIALDTKVFDYLKIAPPADAQQDPRLAKITIGNLIDDSGGWNENEALDVFNHIHEVETAFQLPRPAKHTDIIRYMLGKPLQFDPGYQRVQSRFGYCLLGRVIEKASGKSYGAYVDEAICKPLEITDIKLGRNLPHDRDPREVAYSGLDVNVEILDSSGGFIASAPALCTFMDHFWLSGEPRYAGQTGDGGYSGMFFSTTACLRQRRDGYNVAILYNGMRPETAKNPKYELVAQDLAQLRNMVNSALDKIAGDGKSATNR